MKFYIKVIIKIIFNNIKVFIHQTKIVILFYYNLFIIDKFIIITFDCYDKIVSIKPIFPIGQGVAKNPIAHIEIIACFDKNFSFFIFFMCILSIFDKQIHSKILFLAQCSHKFN